MVNHRIEQETGDGLAAPPAVANVGSRGRVSVPARAQEVGCGRPWVISRSIHEMLRSGASAGTGFRPV
jgi:hypothetical protein